MNHARIKFPVLTLAAIVAIAAALVVVNLASAGGPKRVQPFQADILVTESKITNEDCVFRGGGSTICNFEVDGQIIGTHHGFGSAKADFSFDVSGILSGGCGELIPGSGSVVWTAHDGDELWLSPVSSFNCAQSIGDVNISGVNEIVGGTGRFEKAKGMVSFLGEQTEDGLVNHVTGEIRLKNGS